MITVKLSHTILDAWYRGRWEDALSFYLGQDVPPTPPMILGRLKDEIWTKHAQETGQLHPELGGSKLNQPILQQKYEKLIPLSDDLQILLRGRPDVWDKPIIRDFKCGRTKPSQYLSSFQLPIYKLLLPEAAMGIYDCFNPYTGQYSIGVKYLGPEDAEKALEFVVTYGADFINYLQAEKKLIDYRQEAIK